MDPNEVPHSEWSPPPSGGYPGPGHPAGYSGPGYPGAGYPPGFGPGYGSPGPGYPPPFGFPGYPGQPVAGPPPPSNLGWAIAAIILFWPLGIPALINATRVDTQWFRGDPAGAITSSTNARRFAMWAIGISVTLFVLAIVFFIAVLSSLSCLDGSSC